MRGKPELAAVFQHYGIDTPARSGWAKVKCPIHDDSHASAVINLDEQLWKCFTCDVAGDVYTLIMKKEGVGFKDAIKRGEGFTDGSVSTVRPQSERGLLGVPDRPGHSGSSRRYVPPRFRI